MDDFSLNVRYDSIKNKVNNYRLEFDNKEFNNTIILGDSIYYDKINKSYTSMHNSLMIFSNDGNEGSLTIKDFLISNSQTSKLDTFVNNQYYGSFNPDELGIVSYTLDGINPGDEIKLAYYDDLNIEYQTIKFIDPQSRMLEKNKLAYNFSTKLDDTTNLYIDSTYGLGEFINTNLVIFDESYYFGLQSIPYNWIFYDFGYFLGLNTPSLYADFNLSDNVNIDFGLNQFNKDISKHNFIGKSVFYKILSSNFKYTYNDEIEKINSKTVFFFKNNLNVGVGTEYLNYKDGHSINLNEISVNKYFEKDFRLSASMFFNEKGQTYRAFIGKSFENPTNTIKKIDTRLNILKSSDHFVNFQSNINFNDLANIKILVSKDDIFLDFGLKFGFLLKDGDYRNLRSTYERNYLKVFFNHKSIEFEDVKPIELTYAGHKYQSDSNGLVTIPIDKYNRNGFFLINKDSLSPNLYLENYKFRLKFDEYADGYAEILVYQHIGIDGYINFKENEVNNCDLYFENSNHSFKTNVEKDGFYMFEKIKVGAYDVNLQCLSGKKHLGTYNIKDSFWISDLNFEM